jgi:hypothetical protein
MTISFTLQPIPRWTFNDLDGKPAAGGKLFVRSSLNPTQPKLVYQDAAGMNPWTNPVIFDENGMAPGAFYWKIDDATPEDLYYLFFTDNQGATTQDPGNLIWSENVYPLSGTSGGGGGGGTTTLPENIIVNSSFINNIDTTTTAPIANDTFLAPGAHSGLLYPDIRYILSGSSNANDSITFVPFTTDPGVGINPISPDFLTDYYLRYSCLNSPAGETYKGFQIPISKNVNNISNQTFTLTFYARKTAGVGNQLNFFLYQYFGSGGSPSVSAPVDLGQPRSLSGSFALYSVTFTVPSTLGKTLGNSQDDATYLQIRLPIGVTTTIDIFKPMLFVGSSFPTIIYESTDEIEPKIELPRTGETKSTMNPFSFKNTQMNQNGWIPLNDGTIGNSSSGASTRAKPDTWLLYKLIWEGTTAANCGLFDNLGVSTSKGGSALSDWNANKSIRLPHNLGRVVANSTPTDQPITSTTFTSVNGSSILTVTSSTGFITGSTVVFTVAAPTPLIVGITYFVRVLSATTVSIYYSAEAAIANTGAVVFTSVVTNALTTPANNELAKFNGENSHLQTQAELVSHTHSLNNAGSIFQTGGSGLSTGGSGPTAHFVTITANNTGGSTAFNIDQPTVFYNMIIKL